MTVSPSPDETVIERESGASAPHGHVEALIAEVAPARRGSCSA